MLAPAQPAVAAAAQAAPVLEVRDLVVDYLSARGAVRAVDGVSFSIQPGEVFGLAGESGSGKSTIAHALIRILPPPAVISGGEVVVRGTPVLELSDDELERFRWRDVAMVFQSAMNALNPVLTISDQIVDTIQAHVPASRGEARDRAAALLETVGISAARLDAYPHQLSGGMRQRAVIAIALALEPALIVMDEPTTALDVVVQQEILQEIEDLRRRLGFAILFITHDLSLLVERASRIAIMYAGQIVEQAPARSLFDDPLHPYTQGLMQSFPSLTGEKQRLSGIPGSPPDMLHPPGGCRFHPRCAQVQPAHRRIVPRLREVKPGHFVACHLYGGLSEAAREQGETGGGRG